MAKISNTLVNLKNALSPLSGIISFSNIFYDKGDKLKEFLSKFIDLSNGIPAHDTIMRVFSLLDTHTLESCLVDFLQSSVDSLSSSLKVDDEGIHLLAMDGKEEKGSGRKYTTAEKTANTQIMHFLDTSTGICVKSAVINEKTNEIPTAQTILQTFNIRGFIITSDAMNCQKGTVDVIAAQKAHYVLGLKRNHSSFYSEVEKAFQNIETNKKTQNNYYKMETEKNHNQVEMREFYKLNAKDIYGSDEWNKCKSIVMYKKTTYNNFTGEEKVEKRYYISDLSDMETICQSIRRHWSVENQLHWHLDVNFKEDNNTTMNKKALANLSVINKTVLTLMKLMQPLFGNKSIKVTRHIFRFHYEENIIKIFALLDKENMKELVKYSK